MRFVLFGCIRDRLVALRNSVTTNAPNPPHWTLNLRFAEFATIWVHSGPFGCLMKLGAKRAELVQKFVPRSRVGIFHNEHTRSSPLDPKRRFGAFHTIWVHLGPFGCLMKLGAKRAELVQKFVPQSRVGIFCMNAPNLPHWTLN